jgi:hypothetical protein
LGGFFLSTQGQVAARKGPLTAVKLDEMRRRIQSTLLLKKLEDHVLNGTEMTQTQLRAAEVLLRKTVPDLTAVQLTGEDGGPVETVFRWANEKS